MLAGVLTVLKTIGIILLWILAIILAILLLILFVPIRYKLDGTVPETEFDQGFDVEKIKGSARITWLLHFVSAYIAYPDNKEFTVKILGIKVLPRPEKEEKPKKEKKKKKTEETKEESSEDKEKDSESDNSNIGYIEESDMGELEENSQDLEDTEEPLQEEENTSSEEDEMPEDEKEDKALIEIISDILENIEKILKTPQDVLRNIQYTTSRLCDKIRMIKNTLENDIFKRAFELVKGKLLRLLKMILPDKTKVDLELGLGDPADTAQVMALYGALYPMIFKEVSFEPDFDRKVVYADAHFKGHITVFTVLYCVCVCYFNKDVKKVIRRFKKILNS